MAPIDDLKKKRSAAKKKIILKINDTITPILNLKGQEANENAKELKEAITDLETRFNAFKVAHEAYVNQLEDETDDENIEAVLKKEEDYVNDVNKNYHETLKKVKAFDKEVDVGKAREELKEAFEDFNSVVREVNDSEVNWKDLLESDDLSKDQIEQLMNVPAEDMKSSLSSSYETFTKAVTKVRKACACVEIDHTKVFEEMKIDISKKLIPEQMNLTKSMRSIINLKKLHSPQPSANIAQPAATVCPIKLEKAQSITFSGDARDFATFKRKFEEIIVPNRDKNEVSLRLEQAIPQKHRHLIERFKLGDWKGMMDALDDRFGGSRKIVTSILLEIDKMKVPHKDEQFIENVEKIKKMENDLEAVGLKETLEQETILMKLENLLPENVNQKWLTYAEDNDLLLKRSSTSERYKGFIKFLDKCYRQADWQITKNESLPAHVKTKYSFVSSSQFSQSFLINSKAEDLDDSEDSVEKNHVQKILPKNPCLVCSQDGCTDEAATRHFMNDCQVWSSLSQLEKLKYVSCVLHPFAKHVTNEPERCDGKTICRKCGKEDDHHTLLCNLKTSKSNKTSCKSSVTHSPDVMLKTLFVKTENPNSSIGVIEDNCSTDSFITFEKAEELGLNGTNVTLEIEGINTTERIDSKIFQVPVQDKVGNIHKIECYGLNEITKASPLPNHEAYKNICKSLQIDPSTVKRPSTIDLLLSAKDNYLMSDNVVRQKNGLKLYCGPLGQTISGNSGQFINEHVKAYPSKAKKITPMTFDSLPISPFQEKIYKWHAAYVSRVNSSTVKLAKVNVILDGYNYVENSSNSVKESPTGGEGTIKTEASNSSLTSSSTSGVSVSSTPGPEIDVHSTTLPTSSSPGDGAVVECRRISPAEAICPHPPGGEEVAINNSVTILPDQTPPQKQTKFQNSSKLNFVKAQPSLKFAPMFSTFPCSKPKQQTSLDIQYVSVSHPIVKIDVKTRFVKLAHRSHDYKEKGTVKKKSNQIQSLSFKEMHLPMERTFVSDEEIAIGEDCRIESQTTNPGKYLNCTELFENKFYHELERINPIKF